MGLFDFLGGKKNQGPQPKEAYFLTEDEAKTFGDIDFMRKEVVVRRTFAKKKGQEELESVKSISSSTSKAVGEAVKPATASFGASAFSTPVAPAPAAAASAEVPTTGDSESAASTPVAPAASQEQDVRPAPDTSMDMFRNMAKKIRR
ncbi:hypothetical protein SPB21_23790 [Leptothoe sp. ISB3NOV94-8A]